MTQDENKKRRHRIIGHDHEWKDCYRKPANKKTHTNQETLETKRSVQPN